MKQLGQKFTIGKRKNWKVKLSSFFSKRQDEKGGDGTGAGARCCLGKPLKSIPPVRVCYFLTFRDCQYSVWLVHGLGVILAVHVHMRSCIGFQYFTEAWSFKHIFLACP